MPIIINSKFNPFSYQEMLHPIMMATQAHQALENEFSELDTKASMLEKLKDSEIDREVYQQYKAYSDALKSSSDQLAQSGLTPSSRRAMLDMRSRYSQDIVPIEQAWDERDRQMKLQQEMMLKDPTHMYRVNAGQVGLKEYMSGNYDALADNYSGALLTKQASEVAANLKAALTDKSKLKSLGLPYQYERRLQYGFTPEQVDAAVRGDANADPVLTRIIDQVLQSSGISQWDNYSSIKDKVRGFIGQGIYSAIGTTKDEHFTDEYSMKNQLSANEHARQVAQQRVQNKAMMGNIPIDIHHLISPNQEGQQGVQMVDSLRSKLGISGNLNGRYSRTVDLGSLVTYKSDILKNYFKNRDGGTTVKLYNNNGDLLARSAVVRQGKTASDQKALGKWYDSMYSTLRENFSPNKSGKWNVASISNQMKSITSGSGALTMGAMRLNFGADNNKKVLEGLLPGLTSGDNVSVYEITSFTRDGKINTGSRASIKDFQDDKGNLTGTPMFYAAPNANTDGLIMKYKGKTYLIPRNKLGSLGDQVYNINIPQLQKENQIKQELIKKYGEHAYYSSDVGLDIEQILDNYGAAYLRAAGTALGYSYALPDYNIKENNQSEI